MYTLYIYIHIYRPSGLVSKVGAGGLGGFKASESLKSLGLREFRLGEFRV